MKERPILFSAPMVRAILAGTKTQTRRIVKPQPELNPNYTPSRVDRYTTYPEFWWPSDAARSMVSISDMACLGPYGSAGDRLWVRETWSLMNRERTEAWTRKVNDRPADAEVVYRVDEDHGHKAWRPSIFMPRWASRITLEVIGVRVERLHAITEDDARAEGVTPYVPGHGAVSESELAADPGIRSPRMHRFGFEQVWCDINGAESWDANPWVWVVEFKRVAAQERAA